MKLTRGLFPYCLGLAFIAHALAFGLNDQPLLVLAGILPAAGMLLGLRRASSRLAYGSLVVWVALAGAGVVLGQPGLPMFIVAALALASWDLLLEGLQSQPGKEDALAIEYERLHLRSLGLAVGLGLLGAGVGSQIHWQAPFLVSLGLVVLVLFCLSRVFFSRTSER